MADCWYLKGSGQNASVARANMLVANAQPSQVTNFEPPVKTTIPSRPADEYTPFISKATVSIPGLVGAQTPVVVMRDTGASQSLLLKDKLPQEANTYTGSDVLIQGVDLEVMNIPLHRIQIQSNLVSGPVIVGVRHSLPVQGVDFILGNDLAGDKVQALPCMINTPDGMSDSSVDCDTNVVYPSCAVTRAMAKQAQSSVSHDCEPIGTQLDDADGAESATSGANSTDKRK